MRAVARAQPNIALIKYWGKRDTENNLPAVGSISITLADLFTETCVETGGRFDTDPGGDRLTIDGRDRPDLLRRVSSSLDDVCGPERARARVSSETNFPIAAGLASSASSFAALVVAADGASGQRRSRPALASLAGRASGSAARSLYGGYVELENRADDISVRTLRPGSDWPLTVIAAITATGPKPVSSGDAMEISRRTSPFYERWVEEQQSDLDVARTAIEQRDFEKLAAVAEHNCLKMHSVMWASRPPVMYWNAATLACLQCVRELRSDGVAVFFTIDAGPQVKAVCEADEVARVRQALADTAGVARTLVSGIGPGAELVSVQ